MRWASGRRTREWIQEHPALRAKGEGKDKGKSRFQFVRPKGPCLTKQRRARGGVKLASLACLTLVSRSWIGQPITQCAYYYTWGFAIDHQQGERRDVSQVAASSTLVHGDWYSRPCECGDGYLGCMYL